MKRRIEIAKDFSRYPAGRYIIDGDASGELFRDGSLLPALGSGDVELVLDGVAGLPSSFLEEALGGLIRRGMTLEMLENKLTIIAETPRMASYPEQAWRYIRDAARRATPEAA
jgi:hypothetical protein